MVELLGKMGGIAGIGGLALGVFLILFRDLVRKQIFPKLTKKQSYRIITLMTILVWSDAVIGILSWTFRGNLNDGDYQKISKKNSAVMKC